MRILILTGEDSGEGADRGILPADPGTLAQRASEVTLVLPHADWRAVLAGLRRVSAEAAGEPRFPATGPAGAATSAGTPAGRPPIRAGEPFLIAEMACVA